MLTKKGNNMLHFQEAMRRDDTYKSLNRIIESLNVLDVSPSLTWLYVWDIVKDKIDYYSVETDEVYVISPKFTEKDIFDMFWEDADKNGFSLEHGVEFLHDRVYDWMAQRGIIIDNDLYAEDEVE